MTQFSLRLVWAVLATAVLSPVVRAEAQDDPDCAAVQTALQSGIQGDSLHLVLSEAQFCPSGGEMFAEVWANPSADSTDLEYLVWRTAEYLDQRISTSVEAIAKDAARPQLVRLAALRVLAAYVDPGLSPRVSDLRPSSAISPTLLTRGAAEDTLWGAMPLTTTDEGRIRELTRNLAVSDPDSTIRHAATRVLRAWSEGETVDSSKITLSYICGNYFRVRSTLENGPWLTYLVENTAESGDLYVPDRPADGDYVESIFETHYVGPVQLLYDGQLLHRTVNAGTLCP